MSHNAIGGNLADFNGQNAHGSGVVGSVRVGIPGDVRSDRAYGRLMANEHELTRLAATQNGLATRAQLRDLGLTKEMLRNRFESGRWTPLGRTVVAIGPPPTDLVGRSWAAALAVPRGILSHRTAGLLHRLPGLYITSTEERHLLRRSIEISTAGRSRSRPSDLMIHERTSKPRSLHLHGMRVTTVAQTLIDLAAVLDELHLDRVIDLTMAQNRCTLEALERQLDATPATGVAGTGTLRRILTARHLPGGSMSVMERLFWEGVAPSGLGLPDRQVLMQWGATVDLLWGACKLIGELDSRSWHERIRDREKDARRDAAALSQGYATFRMTWEMVTDELDTTLGHLTQALAQRSA